MLIPVIALPLLLGTTAGYGARTGLGVRASLTLLEPDGDPEPELRPESKPESEPGIGAGIGAEVVAEVVVAEVGRLRGPASEPVSSEGRSGEGRDRRRRARRTLPRAGPAPPRDRGHRRRVLDHALDSRGRRVPAAPRRGRGAARLPAAGSVRAASPRSGRPSTRLTVIRGDSMRVVHQQGGSAPADGYDPWIRGRCRPASTGRRFARCSPQDSTTRSCSAVRAPASSRTAPGFGFTSRTTRRMRRRTCWSPRTACTR